MYWWWFWIWIVFVLVLIFIPAGYGWGYRGWGPPYPRRYRYRTRSGRVVELEELPPEADPARQPQPSGGWGFAGDLIWLAILIAIIWILAWAWT